MHTMKIMIHVSMCSVFACVYLQVGACIVNGDGQVVGVGYNGFAKGIDDDDKTIPWRNDKIKSPAMRKMPYGMERSSC